MNRLQRWLFTAVRKLYAAMLPAVDAPIAHMIEADIGGIHDGADYSRPAVIPGWMRRDALYAPVVAARLQEAASDYRSQFGDPYADNAPIPNVASEDPLREWDWSTRERVLSNCHAVYQRNPLANSIVQFTADFVVGNGFNLSTKNPEVEKVLMDFINHDENAIREYERQAVIDLQVDGELVIQLFKGTAEDTRGQMVIAPRRPWELRYIKTAMGFYKRVEEYLFNRHEQEGDAPTGSQQTVDENIPADQIIFVAVNRHSYELRGRPELYRLLPWLRADTEWLSDRARQSKWRNALLWIVRVAGNAAQIGAILQQWRKPPAPGSAYVSSDRVEVEAATNSANAGDASNDGRAIRLMSIMGARLPEYMFGDGSMANLATATKQELPALTKFETFQQIMIRQLWTPLFKQVIRNAVDAGVLAEEVVIMDKNGDDVPEDDGGGMCSCDEAFEVTYEPVTQQDIAQLTQALSTQAMNGWISDKSAQEKLGLDPHVEAKRIASEAEKKRDEMAQGLRPVPPGQEGAVPGMMDDEEDEPAKANGKKT